MTPIDAELMRKLNDASDIAEKKRMDSLLCNKNNGRKGWWAVVGLRHSALAYASSAIEAVEKADKSGLVESWEFADAVFKFETLPDVFSV